MILSIKDRILLPQLFAANVNSMTEAAVQREIRETVKIIDTDEGKEISLTQNNGGFIWDAKKGKDREFYFTPEQIIYLKSSVYKFNESKQHDVTQDLLPLMEKIWL